MKDSEKNALIKLIEDPNTQVYSAIEKKILELGFSIIEPINAYYSENNNKLVKNRIILLNQKIVKSRIEKSLHNLRETDFYDLKELAYIISLIDATLLDKEKFIQQINLLIEQLNSELNHSSSILTKIKLIIHIIYQIQAYSVAQKNINIKHYFLSNLFSTKVASAEVFALLLMILGKELSLNLQVVHLPLSIIIAVLDSKENILFYINPGYKGSILTEKEIITYLKKQNIKQNKQFLEITPINNFVIHFFSTLEVMYRQEKETTKADFVQNIKQLLIK